MKRMLAIAVAAALGGARAEAPTYVLDIPDPPWFVNTVDAAQNAWIASNCNFVAMSVAGIVSNNASVATFLDRPVVQLASVEAGFADEHARPDYYLADSIEPPEGVDWAGTYELYVADPVASKNFVFDTEQYRLYPVMGGRWSFKWKLVDGTEREMSYGIASSCAGRPRRIYWTHAPYNSPAVNLQGKFVKFFGNEDIAVPRRGVSTNETAAGSVEMPDSIVRGLYIDPSSHLLQTHGDIQGQVVMVYYDSGNFDRILHVQAVEVCEPVVNKMKGEIGRALKADGRGYDTTGLRALPSQVNVTDNRGNYYHQHNGNHSYSPKHGNVYPLRNTVGARQNMEVYWMETDEMKVEWPFELDQYECDWPTDATVFVRGDGTDAGRPVYVPTDYTVELQKFQEPEGHAKAVETDGTFVTTGEGYSLLKMSADDNVWFVPLHSVLRTNTNYFTLAAEDIRVGLELKLRGGAVAGTAPGFAPACNAESSGYIYRETSDPVWNPNIYYDPQPENAGSSGTNTASSAESASDTNTYASVIYAASALDNPKIEVWWNTTLQQEDMPKAIDIPTLPQVYSIRWPKPEETADIVIASQLGSSSESLFSHNMAVYFSDDDSHLDLAERRYFGKDDGGTAMFWVKAEPDAAADARILMLESSTNPVCRLSATLADVPEAKTNWNHVAYVLSTNGKVARYVNGELAGEAVDTAAGLVFDTVSATLGASGGASGKGLNVGELAFWNKALSADEVKKEMTTAHSRNATHLTALYSFVDGTDLNVTAGDRRTVTEKVIGTTHVAYKCLAEENGPPAYGTGVIDADAGATPKVYAQNVKDQTGYNPNEEHAVVFAGDGGYVAWALRTDLNQPTTSPPGVLVEYVKNGRKAMQWFDVALTNAVYRELAADCIAGKAFPGPHPIDLFDNPWCPEDSWDEPYTTAPAFRDRKSQLWARSAGTAHMRMYYRMQDGFAFPSISPSSWPKVGDSIPWLSLLGKSPSSGAVLTEMPAVWTWRVSWPEAVPEIEIGRTLTVAASGLPEVWNAASMGIVWPSTDAERDKTAVLFDPTIAQSAGFSSGDYADMAALIKDMGIKQGAGGNATLRKGKWTFNGLPPSISSRFYIDTTAPLASCMKLIGEQEDNPGGVELLHVNVLNSEERAALAALVDDSASANGKKRWKAAVEALATACVKPSHHAVISQVEERIDYSPRDHYALFTLGATNYITVVENDTTNKLMGVTEGDPISMHVMKVVPKYYTGRVVTREDPLNLLSQMLSVIYAEAFAGQPEQYEFEWRKCRPHANGTVPTDFEGEYQQKFPVTAGLTRFVIGQQGDTLDNMVNTYYAMRYRAASDKCPAYATMGSQWSAWTDPPALAEGWVQRVLNNVTPFAQRMRDLVDNEAETAVSMIRQAGKPYEGDVALNQDNLAEVGLVELYETLLSKAESMSLQLGINDADANKQLQLAVARLADLYNLLGDEAYTDALNPTIGFGANFNTPEKCDLNLDYGALSSTMFAFDNQVPTLLDEELALLRGRSGDNAPSTRLSPFYNRLVWNFTKGITAGEVAYAVNYDISGDNDGVMDETDAAEMYPQGHGDAYGHYLSALSGYYRLLRNPYFSWGPPAMGEMVVSDAALNVDYYDEAQFAKSAYNVAKVAAEVVDRTARKAYRDSGGARGAGYLDAEKTRNFGYGEWASRGGYGALANWAVANALLEEAPTSANYYRYKFDESALLMFFPEEDELVTLKRNGTWTMEFQIVPEGGGVRSPEGTEAVWMGDAKMYLSFVLDETNLLSLALQELKTVTNIYTLAHYDFTNGIDEITKDTPYKALRFTSGDGIVECGFYGANPPNEFSAAATAFASDVVEGNAETPTMELWGGWGWVESYAKEGTNFVVDALSSTTNFIAEIQPAWYRDPYEYEWQERDGDARMFPVGMVASNANTLVAMRCSGGSPEILLFDAAGAKIAAATPDFDIDCTPDMFFLGNGFRGEIGELRFWDGVCRSDAELLAKREYVSPVSDGLHWYLRTISRKSGRTTLPDELDSTLLWDVDGGDWITETESGMSIAFTDAGLNRIDRSTVGELESLVNLIPDIQKKVDRMDGGLNPLGLAENAMAFDMTPIGVDDGTRTHFEQIRERAGVALENARKSLEKAQQHGSRLRLLQEAQVAEETRLDTMELETKNKLIEYFGYPYSGDIGPGGTYPQGYDGPDLLNYAWMEPEACGLSADEDVKSITTNIYKCAVKEFANGGAVLMANFRNTNAFFDLKFEKSATGFILKPANVTGKRLAQGKIQDAMSDYLVAYGKLKQALDDWNKNIKLLDYEIITVDQKVGLDTIIKAANEARLIFAFAKAGLDAVNKGVVEGLNQAREAVVQARRDAEEVIPDQQIAGLANSVPLRPPAAAGLNAGEAGARAPLEAGIVTAKTALIANEALMKKLDVASEMANLAIQYKDSFDSYYHTVLSAANNVNSAANQIRSCYCELMTAQAAVETVIAEAERVIDERTLARQQAVATLTKARYNDMFFRLQRNNALSRYSAQFDLAQKYAYLAARAYDYETGLMSSDSQSGDRFLARIVGARTLGEFADDGTPLVCSDAAKGDGGLAAILAEMDANWLVLKPRLGINNPQRYATWFSLRHDLFRIFAGEDGDRAWRTELRKYVVDDLNAIPEFRRYCQPLAGSTAGKEPGLVIPFPSMIAHGYNFFGEELAAGDASLDATYFATHIASAGIHFDGYNPAFLSQTPVAYLVPVGEDRMRAVGDTETVLSWKVVDQTIPAPYAIGSTELDNPDWTPLYEGNTGGNDLGARIRKHPSFRAYYGANGTAPSDASLDCSRLVGRSAWNTKWMLVIPAGSMGADRAAALSAFIDGIDANRDGQLDFTGVSDIKIGLKTYSTSGN